MTGKKTSPVWTTPRNEFERIVKNSNSIAQILRFFDFTPTGTNHRMVKERCKADQIDFSHIPLGQNSNKGRKFNRNAIPLELIMIENSHYSTGQLKHRLIRNNLIENKCQICGMLPIWNNNKLVLRLDHINGQPKDHRRENLRLLCPNCDSQTNTYCGRKNKKHFFCKDCGKEITNESQNRLCLNCFTRSQRKVERPSLEKLIMEVNQLGYSATGRKYGVSDNAIRKWIISLQKEKMKEKGISLI